jgi:carbamoyl-phosphate synthase large subunit
VEAITQPNTPTVIVIPGSHNQLPLIRKASARGYRVVCADRSEDCAAASVADEFHPIGLDEPSRLLNLARTVLPVGIVTDQTDAGVVVTAWLSEQLGLRGIGHSHALLYTKKDRMRAFGRERGFPTPAAQLCHCLDDAYRAALEIGFPVVVKPVDSQSSKGVSLVKRIADLDQQFKEASRHSTAGDVLIEQFIDGTEFTVEGFMSHSGHRTLCISEKRHYRDWPFVAQALRYTPSHHTFDYDLLRSTHDRWINLSGLPFGLTHAEYKFRDGQYYLIEVAARGGGNRIASEIVPWVSGVDYQDLLLDEIVHGTSAIAPARHKQRCALLEFFDSADGRITSIRGVDAARSIPGVVDVVMHFSPGVQTYAIQDDTTRPGYFIVLTDTESELTAIRNEVLETVVIQGENA